MDDSISRRAMQEIVDRIGGMYPYRQIGNRESYSSYNEAWTDCINRVDAELNSLPSAEPEQRWIPCSERLPDMWDERYLVSLAWGGIGVMEYKSTGFHNYGSFTPVPIESITAWMPLPEPYREERRTDNANVIT